jgi:hypothetical protein
MKKIKITKNRFLKCFIIITVLLALVKCIFPSVAGTGYSDQMPVDTLAEDTVKVLFTDDTIAVDTVITEEETLVNDTKHRILGVRSYREEFPDTNAVQLVAAQKYGVRPVINRADAEKRKDELVYVGSNPYFYINELSASIPYLVPRAAALLQDIGRNFFDSLQVKQVPLHKIKVTSVLRTKEDVEKLRKYNRNATEQSCHLYGTTFDIGYNKYMTVSDPQGPARRAVRDDTLKFVLSEVLRDLRNQNRCYIKYEVKQGCFHITVR